MDVPPELNEMLGGKHGPAKQKAARLVTDLGYVAGALLLKDTCPEVTPYNRELYNHILTNSMKAEHYLKSGLNSMPTSVARISDCVAHAFDPSLSEGPRPK